MVSSTFPFIRCASPLGPLPCAGVCVDTALQRRAGPAANTLAAAAAAPVRSRVQTAQRLCAPVLTLCMASCAPGAGANAQRGGQAPYFSPQTPRDSSAPGGHVFYYTPGETYTFPPPGYSIEIWDDDLNGTLNGWIPTRKSSTTCPVDVSQLHRGCWDQANTQFLGTGQSSKLIEDPVHIEVGAHIGSPDWNPGTSRWWFPYRRPSGRFGERADFTYDVDPFEKMKQQYRCSEYNPTLPGLNYHEQTGQYPGQSANSLLVYPNPLRPSNCWAGVRNSELASSRINVTYTHVRDSSGRILTNRTRLSVTFKEEAWLLDSDIPNPQRIICLTSRGMVGSSNWQNMEMERCWSIIFRVKPKLSVCSQSNGNGPDLTKCGKLSLFTTHFPTGTTSNRDGEVISVAIGQKFKAHVYFDDGNRDLTVNCTTCDTIKITVVSDPGLPNGAKLGETKGPGDISNSSDTSDTPSRLVPLVVDGQQGVVPAFYYPYSREFTFTPDETSGMRVASDDNRNGLKYKMCFFATSTTRSFYPPGNMEQNSNTVCAYIQVVRPEPVLPEVAQLQPYVDQPLPMTAGPYSGLPFLARVRCPYKWKIAGYDKKTDQASQINGDLRYQTGFTAGYDKQVYHIIARADPKNPLPKGARLMHEPGSAYQILSWSPERGMEGHDFSFCLLITDHLVAEGMQRMCTTVRVLKCEVCGLPSDTMNSIALEYKTDWLQLWGANSNVTNPNNLQNFLKLQLGPLHTLNRDEKVETLASRFSMTASGLLEVNPDLKGESVIKKDTQVCLIPRICGDV